MNRNGFSTGSSPSAAVALAVAFTNFTNVLLLLGCAFLIPAPVRFLRTILVFALRIVKGGDPGDASDG
jgi:hypothetical protein